MVARYKHKRHAEEMSSDSSKHLDLEGSERMRAKREIRQGLKDTEDERDISIQQETDWEEEMERAYQCYLKEKADPENYVCRCFESKEKE